MGWLATLLGFGVTIAAILLIYRIAYEGTVDLIRNSMGVQVNQTMSVVISMILLVVFIAVGQWVGRTARDWINAGRRAPPRPGRSG